MTEPPHVSDSSPVWGNCRPSVGPDHGAFMHGYVAPKTDRLTYLV